MPRPPQFSLLILAFFLFWLAGIQAALAEKSPSCGEDARKAIASAKHALATASNKSGGQAAVLTCLIEAVEKIADALPVVDRGPDRHPLLHVPAMPGKADGAEKR